MNNSEEQIKYKGFEIFVDPSYFSMFACRKKGVTNIEETTHFRTVDEAKRFADVVLLQEQRNSVINHYTAKYNDPKVYTIIVDKYNSKSRDCVNIENKNLVYTDMTTHHGLQCNHIASDDKSNNGKYEKIFSLCDRISKLMVELHTLNNE